MRTTSVDRPKAIHSPVEATRSTGIPLDLGWLKQVQVNKSAVERPASTLTTRRTVKQQWQAAWLLNKTSTGKEAENATLPVSLTMVQAIREYGERTGHKIGFKPAGGIRTAKDAMAWLILMKEELGRDWLEPELFRFGASSLLTDIERQLEHYVTGRYSAAHRHPMA